MAVGGPGTAAVLLGAHGSTAGGLSSASVGMRLFTVCPARRLRADDRRPGLCAGAGQRRIHAENRCGQGYLGAAADAGHGRARPCTLRAGRAARDDAPAGTRAVSSPRVLSDLFWMGRYAERAENMARLLTVTRERYHEYRYRQDAEGSECVPVLLAALGRITGTDTGADGDHAEMIAIAPTTLWSLTADRHRPGSLAQSVERLGLAARAVRDQMSNDTWMVLAAVERAVLHPAGAPPESLGRGRALLAVGAHPDAGRDAGAVRGGRRVDGAGRRLDDDGHRQTHRTRAVADRAAARHADHGAQPGCRADDHRVHAGGVRVVGHLPPAQPRARSAWPRWRTWCCSTPRTRGRWSTSSSGCAPTSRRCPASSGSSRPERLVDEISTRLRRLDPADLEDVTAEGQRAELADLLDGIHASLRELSGVITATHLSLPGGMQPLWGPDERG